MELAGTLFVYDSERGLSAIESQGGVEEIDCRGYFLLIGGLGDGLGFADYTTDLIQTVAASKWKTIQPLLASSLGSYGHCTLMDDVRDLDKLLSFLVTKYLNAHDRDPRFVLMGHSTGCQDTVAYLKSGRHASLVSAIILQAPVSDREYFTDEETAKYLLLAKSMIHEGKAKEMMCRKAWDVPITAERFVSLLGRLGDDDMFSSDLSETELGDKLGHVAVPALLVISQDDQYVPENIDKKALGARLSSAMPLSMVGTTIIQGGNHSLDGKADVLCTEVKRFLASWSE